MKKIALTFTNYYRKEAAKLVLTAAGNFSFSTEKLLAFLPLFRDKGLFRQSSASAYLSRKSTRALLKNHNPRA